MYEALENLELSNADTVLTTIVNTQQLEQVIEKKQPKLCAFVSLVMKNPEYVVGAMVMAHSLRMTQTKHKLVCMLTIDLYDEWKDILKQVYDEVILTPYIKYKSGNLFSKKQNQIYDWKDISYTKWYCLSLSQYRKICFLDADLVIVKNIDHLLELPAPAGCFVNPWVMERNNKFHKQYYTNINYGEQIPNKNIQNALIDGFVVVAHCVVLEPSDKLYTDYIKYMDATQYKEFGSYCVSMVDEQSITHYMSKTTLWTQMGYEYNTIPWHIKKTNINQGKFYPPYILHYFNKVKPWSTQRKAWPDLEVWWQYFDSMLVSIDYKFESVQKNNNIPSEICPYCNLVNLNVGKTLRIQNGKYTQRISYIPDHCMIAKNLVICPRLI
jgi:lipopolysaccharide biosynthesis glycosyltransferase